MYFQCLVPLSSKTYFELLASCCGGSLNLFFILFYWPLSLPINSVQSLRPLRKYHSALAHGSFLFGKNETFIFERLFLTIPADRFSKANKIDVDGLFFTFLSILFCGAPLYGSLGQNGHHCSPSMTALNPETRFSEFKRIFTILGIRSLSSFVRIDRNPCDYA